MKDFVILPDVCCDLSEEIRREFGIEDYVCGNVSFSDGRELRSTLDWEKISRDEFYKARSNRRIEISTSPLSPEEYYRIFEKYAKQGIDIISISLSSKISSTYHAAETACKRIMENYPQCKAYSVDSLKMSGAIGLLVMHAFELKNQGKTMDEVIAWLEENKYAVHQMGPIDDLIFVARRGRLTMGKALMGSFAGVKPMGDCNGEGYVSVLTKVKGMNKALDVTVRYLENVATNLPEQYILISHSNRQEYAEKLKAMIENTLDVKKVYLSDVFAACGTNIGPGMVAVYFIGPKITEDMSFEKDVMNKLLNG